MDLLSKKTALAQVKPVRLGAISDGCTAPLVVPHTVVTTRRGDVIAATDGPGCDWQEAT